MIIALILLALSALLALGIGIQARSGHVMGLEQWTVGGRGFGAALVFLLLAGEIYTTFTFLGASGYAYGLGAPAYYILAYGTLAYVLSYFMLPAVWGYARRHKLVSQPDFFAHKYGSQALGVLVALVGVIALVPYLVLQFTGLGVIVEAASYGTIHKSVSVLIGAAVVTLYVIISGIRGSAWVSIIKDTLIILVVLFLGIYLPVHYAGGIGGMFAAIDKAKPGFLAFAASGKSVAWFVSTVLLTACGFFMWPHSFGACFTARNSSVFRKNAILLPLYQLVLLFVFFVGFTAVLVVPGLKGAATNMALLKITVAAFPPWVVGIVGATGVLTALVPGSLIMMTAATLFARNFIAVFRPGQTDEDTVKLAKILVHRPHRRLLRHLRQLHHRRPAADGLQLRHPALPLTHLQPAPQKPRHQRRRLRRHRHRRRRRHLLHPDQPNPRHPVPQPPGIHPRPEHRHRRRPAQHRHHSRHQHRHHPPYRHRSSRIAWLMACFGVWHPRPGGSAPWTPAKG
jgi:SSS family solute:Na+ symporter